MHIYITYLGPIFETCTPIWPLRQVTQINRVESVQSYLKSRIINHDASYSKRFKILIWKLPEEHKLYFDLKLLQNTFSIQITIC